MGDSDGDGLFVGLAGLVVGGLLWKAHRDRKEDRRRRDVPLRFDGGISAGDFRRFAEAAARRVPRVVDLQVHGAVAELEVRSNSGLTTWSATADFRDYGRLTGTYWLTSENDASPIPGRFADLIAEAIVDARHH